MQRNQRKKTSFSLHSPFFPNPSNSSEVQLAVDLSHFLQKHSSNLHLFNQDLFEKLISIAKNPPHIRSVSQSLFMMKALKNERLFRDIKWKVPKRVFLCIFTELRLETFPKFQVIEAIGAVCRRTFFVLEGELWVLKRKTREPFSMNESIRKLGKNKLKDEDEISRMFPDYEVGEIVRKGGSWGERFLGNDELSLEILLAKENTQVLMLKGETFRNLLRNEEKLRKLEELGFFSKVTVFSGLPSHIIQIFVRGFTLGTFKKEAVIYKEGDPSESFYIVKEGEIEISERVQIYDNEEFTADFDAESVEEVQKLSTSLRLAEFNSLNTAYREKNSKKLMRKMQVAILKENQLFGDEEILNPSLSEIMPFLDSAEVSPRKDNPKRHEFLKALQSISLTPRKTTAKVLSSSAEIYIIQTVKFLDIFLNYHRSVQPFLRAGEAKNSWHEKFKGRFTQVTKERKHENYRLTHQRRLSSFLNSKANVNEAPREPSRKDSLLDLRVNDFLGKSFDMIKIYDKLSDVYCPKKKEILNLSQKTEQVSSVNTSAKKDRTPSFFFKVGSRTKSEEKMLKVNENKIKSLLREKGERPLSVNLSEVIRYNAKKDKEKAGFVKRQILMKRMGVDTLFADNKEMRRQINSIFKEGTKGKEERKPKLTSFQRYVEENRRKKS